MARLARSSGARCSGPPLRQPHCAKWVGATVQRRARRRRLRRREGRARVERRDGWRYHRAPCGRTCGRAVVFAILPCTGGPHSRKYLFTFFQNSSFPPLADSLHTSGIPLAIEPHPHLLCRGPASRSSLPLTTVPEPRPPRVWRKKTKKINALSPKTYIPYARNRL